jgi:hypothetical protein
MKTINGTVFYWPRNKNNQYHGIHTDCFVGIAISQWNNGNLHGVNIHFGKLDDIL